MQRLWIPGPLPGLNEIIEAKGNRYHGGRSAYTSLKKSWGQTVGLLAQSQRLQPLEGGHFVYLWREKSKRRDPSNFTAGGRKIIEDALQETALLPNDGWKQVVSFQDFWLVDTGRPGVTVWVMGERSTEPQEYWEKQ